MGSSVAEVKSAALLTSLFLLVVSIFAFSRSLTHNELGEKFVSIMHNTYHSLPGSRVGDCGLTSVAVVSVQSSPFYVAPRLSLADRTVQTPYGAARR